MTQTTPAAGPPPSTDPRSLPGVEPMRGMMDGTLPSAPIAALFTMRAVEVAEGLVVFEAAPERRRHDPIGTVHGGFAATLLDSAMACAVHSASPAGMATRRSTCR